MINLTIDFGEFKDLAESFAQVDDAVRGALWEEVLEISLEGEKRIKDGMPIDTGRAKASWGHFTPQDLNPGGKRISKSRAGRRRRYLTRPSKFSGQSQVASAADAVWEEDSANLQVTQGTRVPYTVYINDGTSRMRGTGHIDMAFEWMSTRLEKLGNKMLGAIDKAIRTRRSGGMFNY